MGSDRARELRQQGIAAAKAGNKDEARRLLQEAIRLEPASEPAWLWLASVARDTRERLFALQKVIEINPKNDAARQALAASQPPAAPVPPPIPPPAPPSAPGGLGLRKLGQPPPVPQPPTPPPLTTASPFTTGAAAFTDLPTGTATPPPRPAAGRGAALPPAGGRAKLNTQEMMSQPPGVPLPGADAVSAAQKQIELLVRDAMAPLPASPLKWVKKTKRRAGEGDVVVLRLYVAGALMGALVVLGIVGTVVVLSNDDLRSIVIAPTRTFTSTPTATPTSTPGVTPTPSPQPRRSPTPTPQPPLNLTPANPYSLPQATDIYPPVFERPLQDAISLLNQGQFSAALPTIEAERGLTTQRFNPNPYYFEAVALIGLGEYDDALDVLDEAEGRLDEAPNDNFAPLIDSGFAQVYYARGLDADRSGEAADAEADFALAQERAEAAREGDPRLEQPYIVLARLLAAEREFSDAIAILDEGLAVDALEASTRLLVTKGDVYFAQREYDLVQNQAFLALYIDPNTEAAYRLQIQAALAQNAPGQAVLYAQTYLFYFPGSMTAYRLLGEARLAEGNVDLALAAYNQALNGEDETAETPVLLAARAALFAGQGRAADALADYTRAYDLTDDPAIRAQRMIAAYEAGRYATALEDADALTGRDALPEAVLDLVVARATLDQAAADDEETAAVFNAALSRLNPLLTDETLPAELLPVVQEYAARAQLGVGGTSAALNLIEQAIAAGRTPSRVYVRGLIHEAQGERQEAARDYEWVIAWGQTYPVPFSADAEERLEALQS